MAIGSSMISLVVGPFVILLLLLLLLIMVLLLLRMVVELEQFAALLPVQLLMDVFGDVGVELLFVMFNEEEFELMLLLVEFK